MANQTLIQVPTNVGEPEELQRFLQHLIEELDIVLGYRGDKQYASQEDLSTVVTQLQASVTTLQEEIGNLQEFADAQEEARDDLFDRMLELSWMKACVVRFEGRNTNGSVTMAKGYNIASGTRTAVGVYEFTLAQGTFAGLDISDNMFPSIDFDTAGLTHTYTAVMHIVSTTVFEVYIFNAGVAYDPVSPEEVYYAGLLNIDGALPPL